MTLAIGTRSSPLWQRYLDPILLLVGLLVLWQLMYLVAGDIAITAPLRTFVNAAELVGTDWFTPHFMATTKAFSASYAISAVLGIVIGLWLGAHRLSGEVFEPILAALYSVPKITLYPLMLLIFGLGLSAKIAFGVIHGVIPIAIFTLNAVRNINPVYMRTARVMRLSMLQSAWTVLTPAVLPEIMTGLRVGFSLTLLGVIIGEMFASQHGLGFMIINGINVHDVKTMTAVILLIVLFSAGSNILLLALERRLHFKA